MAPKRLFAGLRRGPRWTAALLVVLAAVPGSSGDGPSAPAPGTSSGGPSRKFTLVYNVNNAGYWDVCGCKHKDVRQGSVTRRAAFLKQLRATDRKILLLDGGSTLFSVGSRVKDEELGEAVRRAELIVDSYNLMGYHAMAVGAFDLAAGMDHLRKLQSRSKFKFLSANLADRKSGKLYFEPHAVFEVAGLRIGVVGLTIETLTKYYLEKVAPDAQLLDPIAAAKNAIAELRPKTDFVIALSHLRQETNFDLAKQIPELPILIDPYIEYGNHKTWLKDTSEWLLTQGDTLFLRSDGQGARMGVVDIELVGTATKLYSGDRKAELEELVTLKEASDADKAELKSFEGQDLYRFTMVSLEPHHLTDPDVDRLVALFKDPAKIVPPPEGPLPRKKDFLTHVQCKSCHPKQHEWWLGTRHAHAYETLQKTGDHLRFDCIGCHSLGYGQAFLDTRAVENYANVQCESCHGTSPAHAEDPKKHSFPKISRNDCIVCHNKEQTRAEFPYVTVRKRMTCPKG
jgi:hypothetical protein